MGSSGKKAAVTERVDEFEENGEVRDAAEEGMVSLKAAS